jgi:hypothetical protein
MQNKTPWHPSARKFADNGLVPVQIGFPKKEIMDAARTARDRWNPDAKLWFFRYGKTRGTELEKHMILDAFPNKEKGKSI